MSKKIIKRDSLSKQVSDELEQMIAAGEYKIGEKIQPEKELMEIFNVSRNTLREAIKSLASVGILEVRQGDGTYVKANNRFNANMGMVYSKVSMADIKEARCYIEIAIVRFAALRRTDSDLERIYKAYKRRSELKESLKENTIADIKFHMVIAQSCHNKIFIEMYKSIFYYLENHIAERHIETEENVDEIEELHRKLYLAIKERDPDSATQCAQRILEL